MFSANWVSKCLPHPGEGCIFMENLAISCFCLFSHINDVPLSPLPLAQRLSTSMWVILFIRQLGCGKCLVHCRMEQIWIFPLDANRTFPHSIMATKNYFRPCQMSLGNGISPSAYALSRSWNSFIFSVCMKYTSKKFHLIYLLYWFPRDNSHLKEMSDLGLAACSWVKDTPLWIQVKGCN